MTYIGNELSMIILLPEQEDGLTKVEAEFLQNPDTLNSLFFQLDNEKAVEVDLKLPKLKVEDRVLLKDTLTTLGMEQAFTDDADFSRMAIAGKQPDGNGLKIGQVVHQTFLEVDEKGTAAAAATAVATAQTPSTPKSTRRQHCRNGRTRREHRRQPTS